MTLHLDSSFCLRWSMTRDSYCGKCYEMLRTEMMLPDGTLFHSASQCASRSLCQAGVWLVPNPALRRGVFGGPAKSWPPPWVRARPRMASVNSSPHWGSISGECPEGPHWGSSPSTGYRVIEPTGHAQAIYIAVTGAASAYRLYSVDLEEILGLHFPTGWMPTRVSLWDDSPCLHPLTGKSSYNPSQPMSVCLKVQYYTLVPTTVGGFQGIPISGGAFASIDPIIIGPNDRWWEYESKSCQPSWADQCSH